MHLVPLVYLVSKGKKRQQQQKPTKQLFDPFGVCLKVPTEQVSRCGEPRELWALLNKNGFLLIDTWIPV